MSVTNHFVQNWESSRRNLLQKKRGQLTREIGLLKIIVSLNINVEIFRTFPEKKTCKALRMRCKNAFISTSGHYIFQKHYLKLLLALVLQSKFQFVYLFFLPCNLN